MWLQNLNLYDRMENRRKLKIGLFGFGCVGKGLYDVLQGARNPIAEIVRICVKDKEKSRAVSKSLLTFDKSDILDNDEVNLVVELIDDSEAAFEIVCAAMRNGKSVVSANKKMIAEHLPELLRLQDETRSAILYEAAACASIPIIRNLEEYYDTDSLNRLEGIVNGSTNFILSKSLEEGLSFANALSIAQNLGYAESDPALDVEGHDAAFKLALLSLHAFGLYVEPSLIFRVGITAISHPELKFASQHHWKIKLLAKAYKTERGIASYVLPAFVDDQSPLFQVNDVFNGVTTETVFADKQFFSGRGAGAFPTASAVLSDISALSYGYKYEYKKRYSDNDLTLDQSPELKLYLRAKLDEETRIIEAFGTVSETYRIGNLVHILGSIRLDALRQILRQNDHAVPLLLPEDYPIEVPEKRLEILEDLPLV